MRDWAGNIVLLSKLAEKTPEVVHGVECELSDGRYRVGERWFSPPFAIARASKYLCDITGKE